MSTATSGTPESQIVIVGVGLIGGSIAAAVRHRFPDCRINGVGRSEQRLQQAQSAGLIDRGFTRIDQQSVPAGALTIICVPVAQIPETVREVAPYADQRSAITDAGSAKSLIYRELQDAPQSLDRFVGSHPIAGSENSGFEHAQENLFEGRMCVITPEGADADNVERVRRFWTALGSHVQLMSACEHDRILSLTSHLPHVMAAVTAGCVPEDLLPFTGTGFRDTTRVAAGSADLWSQILCANSDHVSEAIRTAEEHLKQLRQAVRTHDAGLVEKLLQASADLRNRLKLTVSSARDTNAAD